jgi:hypothetical protein
MDLPWRAARLWWLWLWVVGGVGHCWLRCCCCAALLCYAKLCTAKCGVYQRGPTNPPKTLLPARPKCVCRCVSEHLLEAFSVGNAVSWTLCTAAGAALHR